MIGDLVGAPIVRCVRDLNAVLRGGVHVDDVDARAVARDDAAVRERFDRPRPDGCVLAEDSVGVVRHVDDLVLALALRRDELEASAFDDRSLDLDVSEVIVEDDHLHVLRTPPFWRAAMRAR